MRLGGYETLYSICAKLTERLEFLVRMRRISPGRRGLGRLPFAALISKVSEGSGSASSAGKSSEMASSGSGSVSYS
jgi:hypothetical protein